MRVFILGGTGFIGGFLIEYLVQKHHDVVALMREGSSLNFSNPKVRTMIGDALRGGEWQKRVGDFDVVINLVGSTIFTRWTEEVKKRIAATRIMSTRKVVEALGDRDKKIFICANAVGYYGDKGNTILDERSPAGTDFLAKVCKRWQKEALAAEKNGHRVVIPRFGPVLGPGGGIMAKMVPIFKLGLGGKIGNGQQWLPWIHIYDLCRIVEYMMDEPSMSGPVNTVGPELVTNEDFAKTLGQVLRRPVLLPVPAFMVKLALGEASQALLDSMRVVPKVLINRDFSFTYPDLEYAVRNVAGLMEK